ncbi:nitrate- and nitrite sensing domain-containing protein [Nocardia sp. NPDC058379]|uniref:sensor histidine kinase n=1 Tax=unclassified Nocardia TaxID=2637762 RepID=UPI00366A0048
MNDAVDPLVVFIIEVQNERSLSLAALNGDSTSAAGLPAQRARTDAALAEIGRRTPELERLAPDGVDKSSTVYVDLVAAAPGVRQAVDLGHTDIGSVDDFYRRLAGVIATGLEGLAIAVPDARTAAAEMTAADLFQMAELHSRAFAIGAARAAREESLSVQERRIFAQLVGGYRHQLEGLTGRLTDDGRQRVARLVETAAWRTATGSQELLAERGTLEIPFTEWQAAERVVAAELIGVFRDHVYYANAQAAAAADRSIQRSLAVAALITVISIGAFVMALRLANRLIRRLRSLRSRSLELANETLPSIVRRIHDGEQVDVVAETTMLDTGQDEIGQVALAFGAAQRTAMVAAAAEARTRDGFNKVFLDIAHRSQVLVRRQLDVLDIAESEQHDPEHLELLFQLDHLATRARRNAENLLILGGEQPGRRWRQPVALEQIVRSAVSETNDLTRVSAIRLPQVHVLGGVVADLIHLLAELIDNATLFSPPQSLVSVQGNRVGRGVVVEVEDQGLGIRFEERERLNELLREPPDFQEIALAGHRPLGLFVVSRLAERHSITVSLHDSAYGGVKAIVLIPAELLAAEPEDHVDEPVPMPRARARHAAETVPRGHDLPQLPPWPGEVFDEPAGVRAAPTEQAAPDRVTPLVLPTASTGTRRAPLPKRRKQTHLAPQLQVADEPPTAARPPSPDSGRPATEIRRSMSAFQQGTFQARNSAAPDPRNNGWSET